MAIILPQRFNRQPQYVPQIANDPLSNSIKFALLGNIPTELRYGIQRTGTVGTLESTPFGTAYLPATSAATWVRSIPDLDPTAGGSFTVNWYGYVRTNTQGILLNSLGASWGWYFYISAYAPGFVKINFYSQFGAQLTGAIATCDDNSIHSLTGICNAAASTAEFFMDGVSLGAAASWLHDTTAIGTPQTFGTYDDSGGAGTQKTLTLQAYRGARSPAEIKWLSDNPYGWLAQPSPRLIFGGSSGVTAYTLPASAGSLAITGTAATLKAARLLSAASGSVAISGQAAILKLGRVVSASAGSLAISGQAVSLKATRILSAVSGALVIAGKAATLTKLTSGAYTLPADSGSIAISGKSAGLVATRVLSASNGSLAISGTAASLIASRRLSASSGSLLITGSAATLTYAGINHYSLPCDSGSLVISGSAVTLRKDGGLPDRETGGDDVPRVLLKKRKPKTLRQQPNKHLESIFDKAVKEVFEGDVITTLEAKPVKALEAKAVDLLTDTSPSANAKVIKALSGEMALTGTDDENVFAQITADQDDEDLLMLIAEMY